MARVLIDESKPQWVEESDLIADGDKDVRYQVRPISVERWRALRKSNTSMVPNKYTHRKDEKVDDPGLQDDALDYCLVAWEGIYDGGNAAPCSLEHKKKLPVHVIGTLVDYASGMGGGRTAEERQESFRTTD